MSNFSSNENRHLNYNQNLIPKISDDEYSKKLNYEKISNDYKKERQNINEYIYNLNFELFSLFDCFTLLFMMRLAVVFAIKILFNLSSR